MKLAKIHKDFELLDKEIKDKILEAIDSALDGITDETEILMNGYKFKVVKVNRPGDEHTLARISIYNEDENISRHYGLYLIQ